MGNNDRVEVTAPHRPETHNPANTVTQRDNLPGLLPPGAIPPSTTRVMIALLHVWNTDGRCTIRAVAEMAVLSPSTVSEHHLPRLYEAGLVDWTRGQQGTLRPLVWPTDESVVDAYMRRTCAPT